MAGEREQAVHPSADLRALPLRARKRVMTRRSILDAAERLFEQRGLTSPEMRAAVAGQSAAESIGYVCDWLLAAGESA